MVARRRLLENAGQPDAEQGTVRVYPTFMSRIGRSGKRYWLSSALIALALQAGLLVFTHFYLAIMFGCVFNPRHCPWWKSPWLDAIVILYLAPLWLLSALSEVLELSELPRWLLTIGLYLAYLAVAFFVGALAGTWYCRKRTGAATEGPQVPQV